MRPPGCRRRAVATNNGQPRDTISPCKAQERGQKALEKRVAGLSSLLVASTLLNLAMPMVIGPMRKLTFVAAAFFGTKALPALL